MRTFLATILTLVLAASLSALLSVAPSSAASRLTDDLTELLKMATAVVEVTVSEQHVRAENAASLPFTVVTLKVEKIYKGALEAGSAIQAEYIGGTVNGQRVISPGQPKLNVGQRAVLLLTQVPQSENWRILGGDVGQIVLGQDGSGKDLAYRGSGRFNYYVADAQSITGYRPVAASVIYADQLQALLDATLKIGRPVLEKQAAAATMELPAPTALSSTTLHTTPSSDDSFLGRILGVILVTTLAWAGSRYLLRKQSRHAMI